MNSLRIPRRMAPPSPELNSAAADDLRNRVPFRQIAIKVRFCGLVKTSADLALLGAKSFSRHVSFRPRMRELEKVAREFAGY